jgi:hypothetical protein
MIRWIVTLTVTQEWEIAAETAADAVRDARIGILHLEFEPTINDVRTLDEHNDENACMTWNVSP